MDAALLYIAANSLQQHSPYDRLDARGTLRIALKAAGLEPKNLTESQLQVVFEQVMPGELESAASATHEMSAPPCSPTSGAPAVPQRTPALPAPTISFAASPTGELIEPNPKMGSRPAPQTEGARSN